MTVAAADVAIQRPCPVDLPEDFRGGARNRHCGHCNKTVHLLSTLTEAQAQTFLADNAGKDICITYLVGADGNIQFRPEPTVVPLSALRRPRKIATAVGLGLALAACAPHDNPRIEAGVETRETVQTDVQSKVNLPTIPSEPCEPPVEQMMAGGIGPAIDPPPVVEPPKKIEKVARPPMRAGGIRPMPAPTMVRGGRG